MSETSAVLAEFLAHKPDGLGPEGRRLLERLARSIERDGQMLERAARLAESGITAASAMHELKQPLLAVKAYAQLLQSSADAQTRERAQVVLEQASRMESVILRHREFLLNEDAEKAPLELPEVVAEACRAMNHQLTRCKAKLELKLEAALPPLRANRRQLIHAVANLLANAADSVDQVGGGRIEVGACQVGGEIRLTVADWGAGVSADAEPHLFEPFFTTKGQERGTGLGLVICRRVAENHGGRAERLSAPPGGARAAFLLALPLATQAQASAPPPTPAPGSPAAPPSRRRSVLVVDDEPVVRMVLREMLEQDGLEVIECADAESGLETLRQRSVDLLITDKNLPGMDGLKLVAGARGLRPGLVSMVMTGYPSVASAKEGLELGIAGYLAKPFDDIAAVRSRVQQALGSRRPSTTAVPRVGRVLVFERHKAFGDRLVEAVGKLGHAAAVVGSVEEAEALSARGPFDAALVCWESAGGVPAMERVKAMIGAGPLVIFTEQSSVDRMMSAINLGAKACMPKLVVSSDVLAQELAKVIKVTGAPARSAS